MAGAASFYPVPRPFMVLRFKALRDYVNPSSLPRRRDVVEREQPFLLLPLPPRLLKIDVSLEEVMPWIECPSWGKKLHRTWAITLRRVKGGKWPFLKMPPH